MGVLLHYTGMDHKGENIHGLLLQQWRFRPITLTTVVMESMHN